MATSSKNNIKKSNAPRSVFPDISSLLSSAVTINQGDLCYLDTATHLVKAIGSDGNAATLLGVATEKIVSGKVSRPYSTDVDASQAAGAVQGPAFSVVAEVTLKTGDTINQGDKVYYDTDAQSCTSTAATNMLGIYQGAAIVGAAAGTKIQIMVVANYPAAGMI